MGAKDDGSTPTELAYSSAAGSALSSYTVRLSGSDAVTTSLVAVGPKWSWLKMLTGYSVSKSTSRAASRWTWPSCSRLVPAKARSSPAEPPTSGMPSSAQAMAETIISSHLERPSISDTAKRLGYLPPSRSSLARTARPASVPRSTLRWCTSGIRPLTTLKPCFGKATTRIVPSLKPAGVISPEVLHPASGTPGK